MQIQEVFGVEAAPAAVWPFVGQVERVARCLKSVEVLGPERYKVVASQEVGCISATFELTTSLSRPGTGGVRRVHVARQGHRERRRHAGAAGPGRAEAAGDNSRVATGGPDCSGHPGVGVKVEGFLVNRDLAGYDGSALE
jgi:carbon monoxide dehydrogenase subunit G